LTLRTFLKKISISAVQTFLHHQTSQSFEKNVSLSVRN